MKNPLHNELDLSSYWMPFTGNRAFKNEPRLMKSAQGLYYTTVDDRQIMDGMSGLWCCNAGHCHPHIVEAIRQAAGALDYSPEIFRLAQRLANMMPEGLRPFSLLTRDRNLLLPHSKLHWGITTRVGKANGPGW